MVLRKVGVLEVRHFFHCLETPPLVWEVERFEYVREGSVVATDSLDRGLEVEEARLLDGGRQLCPEPPSVWGLVTHNNASRLENRLEHSLPVPWQNANKVNDLQYNKDLSSFT